MLQRPERSAEAETLLSHRGPRTICHTRPRNNVAPSSHRDADLRAEFAPGRCFPETQSHWYARCFRRSLPRGSAAENWIRMTGRRRYITIERVLLTAILVLQAAIFVRVGVTPRVRGRLPSSVAAETPDELHALAGEDSVALAKGQSPQHVHFAHDSRLQSAFADADELLDSFLLGGTPSGHLALHDARRMQREFDRAFGRAFLDFGRIASYLDIDRGWDMVSTSPAMDMRRQDASYVVLFSLPGVDESRLAVTLEGRLLTVQASLDSMMRGSAATRVFRRQVLLPGPVDDSRPPAASVTNGMLRIVVPRGRGTESGT